MAGVCVLLGVLSLSTFALATTVTAGASNDLTQLTAARTERARFLAQLPSNVHLLHGDGPFTVNTVVGEKLLFLLEARYLNATGHSLNWYQHWQASHGQSSKNVLISAAKLYLKALVDADDLPDLYAVQVVPMETGTHAVTMEAKRAIGGVTTSITKLVTITAGRGSTFFIRDEAELTIYDVEIGHQLRFNMFYRPWMLQYGWKAISSSSNLAVGLVSDWDKYEDESDKKYTERPTMKTVTVTPRAAGQGVVRFMYSRISDGATVMSKPVAIYPRAPVPPPE